MKKLITAIAITGVFFALLPSIAADTKTEAFLKKLKICSTTSYTYRVVNGTALKRSVTGTQPGKGGFVCQFEQEMSKTKSIKCNFPINNMGKITTIFRNGGEKKMFEDYIEDETCTIKE